MKRADAIRQHLEDAAGFQRAAETATGPARDELLASAREHEGLADAARVGEYPTNLDD